MGKPLDPGYWRAWRAAHPEYRDQQNERRRIQRAEQGRGDRRTEYAKRASRATAPIPELHVGHPLFDEARRIVGPRPGSLVTLLDPLHDDLLSVAVLALLEGTDPAAAVRAYRATERRWGYAIVPFIEEIA